MKDLGYLHYFLGVIVEKLGGGFFLHQTKYAYELLDRARMTNCKPVSTLMAEKLCPPDDDALFDDPHLYQSIVGGLQYLNFHKAWHYLQCQLYVPAYAKSIHISLSTSQEDPAVCSWYNHLWNQIGFNLLL